MDFVHPVRAVIPGVHGRVLPETTAELNFRTLARLADVSAGHASRVGPRLVELGLVERREVPPASQFRLARSNVAARAVIELARSRDTTLRRIGEAASQQSVAPVSLIVFGTFARRKADANSDLDAVFVCPDTTEEDDEVWADSVEEWPSAARAITGNAVQILAVSSSDVQVRLRKRTGLGRDIPRERFVAHGLNFSQLQGANRA